MQPSTYECGIFVLAVYRAAKSDNIDELLAIASTLRNRVAKFGKTYSEICETAEINQGYPSINNPVLITPGTGLLAQIEEIYRNIAPDYTSSANNIEGALYFGRAVEEIPLTTYDENDIEIRPMSSWLYENVIRKPDKFQLLGTWGSQQFWGEVKNKGI